MVETTPVGVAVFDAQTGRPVSCNREARRIVQSLRTPGRSPEHPLQVMPRRFADGHEIALDRFPLAAALGTARTTRGEAIVLSVPDGRSVATRVNATPTPCEHGAVKPVVVTMQDLARPEALDRIRAEFLSLVSHELRTPLAAIKGPTTTVLHAAGSFGPGKTQRFFRIIDEQPTP